MKASFFYLVTVGILAFVACDPAEPIPTPQPTDPQNYKCIKLFDEVGQSMGLHGDCTSSPDWGGITLNATESGYLNFADTISLSGTAATTFTTMSVYPCPVKLGQPIGIRIDGADFNNQVKLKIAFVDEAGKVVRTLALKSVANNHFYLEVDSDHFAPGKYYRMYYRISSEGNPSLFEGYGNFLVCKTWIDGVNTTIENDCF